MPESNANTAPMKKKIAIPVLTVFIILCSCCSRSSQVVDRDQLKQADLDFSEYSVTHGMNAAFVEFADSAAVLLRPEMQPVEGIHSITQLLKETDDSSFNLSWEPSSAVVSSSGDMGYTYGIYILSTGQSRHKGTYVTVWKLQPSGKWKFVLDSGNAGLGEADN